jgi:hypothetical protein
MKSLFKFVFVLLLVGVIAAIVASVVSKKKLESMSDDEIREYLGIKLAGKVGDDQITTIQDAVITGVRGKKPAVDHYIEDVDEAMDELAHVAEDVEDGSAVQEAEEPVVDAAASAE